MQYSMSFSIVFLYLVCVSVELGVRRHLTEPEVAWAIQMVKDGFSQRDAYGVRVWCLEHGPDSKPLGDL